MTMPSMQSYKSLYSNRLFIAIGLIICTNLSFSQSWLRCAYGLPQDTAVSSLAKIGNTLYAGTQHAGVYKSTDGGMTWVTTNLHNAVRMSIVKCMTTIDTFLFVGQTANGVSRTTINGSGWTTVNNGIPMGNGNQAIFDMITIGDTLYAASNGGGVFMSMDKGDHWTNLYANQGLNDLNVLSLAANHHFLFAGTAGTNTTMPDTGVAFVTPLLNSNSWSVINNGFVRNGAHLEAVSAMTANDSLVFAGTDDVGIHRSTDNGQTWVRIPGTELNGDIWAIKIVGNQVYYGTLYHGIFTSDDFGMTYYENNTGLNYNGISIPDLVDDFVILGSYIYAATTTGVYKQMINQISGTHTNGPKTGSVSVNVFPNPFIGKTEIIILDEPQAGLIRIMIMDIFGREIRTNSDFIPGDSAHLKIDLSDMPEGVYFYYLIQDHKILHTGKLISE
ncbi:MAG: T9SS type A sorting domain-containing protein [Saprospiraceae bacterium]